jgi:hypothetical protein
VKKNIYLALSILGLTGPYAVLFWMYSIHEPIANIINFLFWNSYSAMFTVDLLISVIVFWFFMIHEARKLTMKNWWIYILATLTVGLSFALPLFLYFRERQIEKA